MVDPNSKNGKIYINEVEKSIQNSTSYYYLNLIKNNIIKIWAYPALHLHWLLLESISILLPEHVDWIIQSWLFWDFM